MFDKTKNFLKWNFCQIWPSMHLENDLLIPTVYLNHQRTSQAISRKSDGQEQSVYDYDFVPTEYEAKLIFLKIGHFSWFVEGVKIGGSEVKKKIFSIFV